MVWPDRAPTAANQFDISQGWSPMQFVNEKRKQGTHIMGIGHRVKSVSGVR